jgi:hypothetical protein
MELTSRDDALELARLHMEEDAVPVIRRIEAAISTWDGTDALRVSTFKGTSLALVEYVAQQYRSMNWEVQVTKASDYYGPGLYMR